MSESDDDTVLKALLGRCINLLMGPRIVDGVCAGESREDDNLEMSEIKIDGQRRSSEKNGWTDASGY